MKRASIFFMTMIMIVGLLGDNLSASNKLASIKQVRVLGNYLTYDANTIQYVDKQYTGFKAGDQLMRKDSINAYDDSISFSFKSLPQYDQEVVIGICSDRNKEGENVKIDYKKSEGTLTTHLVILKFESDNKLKIMYKTNTKQENPNNGTYIAHQQQNILREFRLPKGQSFVEKKIKFANKWNGKEYVVSIQIEDATYYESLGDNQKLINQETDKSEIKLPVGTSWNASNKENFLNGKGYFFIEPGEAASLSNIVIYSIANNTIRRFRTLNSCVVYDRKNVKYTEMGYTGFNEEDQLIVKDPVDTYDSSLNFSFTSLPKLGEEILLGMTSDYQKDGELFNIDYKKGNGTFAANMAVLKLEAENKLTLTYKSNTKLENPDNNSYLAHQQHNILRQFRLPQGQSFEGKEITFSHQWDGKQYVIALEIEGATFYQSVPGENQLQKQTDNKSQILLPVGDRWNASNKEDFRNGKGYYFITPGTSAALSEITIGSSKDTEVDTTIKEDYSVVKAKMGVLKPFWDGHPGLMEHVGSPLREVPSFLTSQSLDFPYLPKQGTKREAIHGEALNLVRFLGGWRSTGNNSYGSNLGVAGVSQYDLAYRDKVGNIQYRFGEGVEPNYIKERLDPYVKSGYTDIRIVLDNIPYCFPAQYKEDIYGQYMVPQNMNEWSRFIEAICLEIKRLYGKEFANSLAFRLGTEVDTANRFTTQIEDYKKMYRVTEQAVTKILPQAQFGPYNNLGSDEHILAVANYAQKEKLKFDWVAYSVYKFTNRDIDAEVKKIKERVEQVKGVKGQDLPFEIHEYDMLSMLKDATSDQEGKPAIRTVEYGARGGAANFHMLMGLYEAGLDKLYHWNTTETIKVGNKRYTFTTARYWLYSIWESLLGAQVYDLKMTKESGSSDLQQKAVAYMNSDKGTHMVMISSFNKSSSKSEQSTIKVYLPKKILSPQLVENSQLKYTVLDEKTDVYTQIKKDYKKAGILAGEWLYNPHSAYTLSTMATNQAIAQAVIDKNYSVYEKMMQDTLTLKDYKGSELKDYGTYYELEVKMSGTSTLVIAIENK